MPPLPSPGKVVKMIAQFHFLDSIAQNIQYFQYDTAARTSVGDLSGLWSHIDTDFLAAYTGATLSSGVCDFIKMIDLIDSSGAEYETVPTFLGTNTGNPLSSNNAVCVQHTINRRYRGGHPRTYMMVGADGDMAAGSIKDWQASFLTNIQNGWDSFNGLFPYHAGLGTWTRVSVSYYETVGGVRTVRATPLVDPILADVAKVRVCSQRRRLGKANA